MMETMDENKTNPPCHVVRDLLPLYHDGVVSAETRSAVGEHLMECADCRAEYEQMEKALPVKEAEPSTKKRFLAMMGRQKRRRILAIVLAAVLAAAAAVGGITALNEWHVMPVSADECELKDICYVDTPDGRMAFVLWSCAYGGSTTTRCRVLETEDGARVEIEIRRPVLEWVFAKGSERAEYWFVPIEGDMGEVCFNGRTVWTAEEGIREDTGYAQAFRAWDQALREAGSGRAAYDFADDYVYLLFPDGHEEYWSYDGQLLEGPAAGDGGEPDWSLVTPTPEGT